MHAKFGGRSAKSPYWTVFELPLLSLPSPRADEAIE